ncbi:hypothetical protein CLOSTMETH_00250 [[Clostridium] methylpentosum DSM 5476]|uniref:Uncharacterized protein n=1 Tax=[Clostridium] methylpentosum DSM 5476 TaxID=537013 RepID=C0E8V5_9FIRM|nr:hypothetical protein CLOSTMETH_00250 [[Clostridium] methylpentosum DSM 5476]
MAFPCAATQVSHPAKAHKAPNQQRETRKVRLDSWVNGGKTLFH